ncbi:dienelactone hydrolase family protein [Sphingomonas sp. AOB5]|uniref:dienelactone hydrolase family protein n=1 Tax=Sphingomonas sp. AOB5 TaxID=3034017 RepID=UPI0023F87A96|nr:dienelactone hydrolase family protein [Sphingomonas sp. AOB5]MDF7775618.1 dienelactone hydrolase family protein [Sphingomonas sp. AOB5]
MGELRKIAEGGEAFSAYRADPADSPAGGGVLVIQEIFGLTPFVTGVVDDFAGRGYSASAPDLFWRAAPNIVLNPGSEDDRTRAMQLNAGLDEALAIIDCDAAVRELRSGPGGAAKVGAVGYCLGGRLAYLLAARTDIDAAVGYYGVAIDARLDEAVNIRAPLMLHIAGEDHLCPPEVQRVIVDTLRERAPSAVVHIYEGAGHGFARVGSPAYNAEAAELANRRTAEFLAKHLAA